MENKKTQRRTNRVRRAQSIKQLSIFSVFTLVLASCVSAPMRVSHLREGEWHSRVTVVDKKKDKTIPLTVVFKAVPNDRLRMDVTTPTGIYVGNVTVDGDQFQALVASEKKFYRGRTSAEMMNRVLSVPVDPRWINHFLFEIPPKDWDCSFDSEKFLESCVNKESDIRVNWSQRSGRRKLIRIEGELFSAEIFISRFFSNVADQDSVFKLDAPKGFRIFRIR